MAMLVPCDHPICCPSLYCRLCNLSAFVLSSGHLSVGFTRMGHSIQKSENPSVSLMLTHPTYLFKQPPNSQILPPCFLCCLFYCFQHFSSWQFFCGVVSALLAVCVTPHMLMINTSSWVLSVPACLASADSPGSSVKLPPNQWECPTPPPAV